MTVPLDRENWGATPCSVCHARRAQLVIDKTPEAEHGTYFWGCWQCYWQHLLWRLGPIVNAGVMWDVIDQRRQLSET